MAYCYKKLNLKNQISKKRIIRAKNSLMYLKLLDTFLTTKKVKMKISLIFNLIAKNRNK